MSFLKKNAYDVLTIAFMVVMVGVALYNPYWLHWKSVVGTLAIGSLVMWGVVIRDYYAARKAKQAITGEFAHEIGTSDRVDLHRPAVLEDEANVVLRPRVQEREMELRERSVYDEDSDDSGAAGGVR